MKNGNNAGFEQAYNAQAAVDQASRFIVACSLSNHANDTAEVAPTLAALAPELGTPPAAALDNGFWSEQNIAALEQRQIEPDIATGREPHHQSWQARFAGEPEPPPADASSQVKMAYKLHTAAGQELFIACASAPSNLFSASSKLCWAFDSSCYVAPLQPVMSGA